jgi:bifunctional non-homologous end joining protein LigD
MVEKNPEKITIERVTEKRGAKLYFDYLQLWRGRTMPAPYTARATENATVSTPVTWKEVAEGIHPTGFTILTVPDRMEKMGDFFQKILHSENKQSLDEILRFIQDHSSKL